MFLGYPRVSTASRTSIRSAVFAQPRDGQTDWQTTRIIDCSSPHRMHLMRPKNTDGLVLGSSISEHNTPILQLFSIFYFSAEKLQGRHSRMHRTKPFHRPITPMSKQCLFGLLLFRQNSSNGGLLWQRWVCSSSTCDYLPVRVQRAHGTC